MSKPKKKSKSESLADTCRRAFRYRAYPTDLQAYKMENWFLGLQGLYNMSIEQRRTAYKSEQRSVTYTEQQNALPNLRKSDPLLKSIHSQVLQDCLHRVDKAYQKFFDDAVNKSLAPSKKNGYPRMKKLENYKSFTFPQVWMLSKNRVTEVVKLRYADNSRFVMLILPGIGQLKIRLHRPVDWENAKTVTVKRTQSGAWYVSISVLQPLQLKLPAQGKATGIDVGITNLAVTSDKNYTGHPKFLRKSEEHLKKLQRELSRMEKGSLNYEKQRLKLAQEHEHVANQRKDFLHKLSFWLVLNYAFIAFENLNIPGMVRNPHLAKSILDAGWGTLIQFTAYKSVMLRGNNVVRVNPAYTSQDCSVCHCRVPKTLADRLHICPYCNTVMERDYNAANVVEFRAYGSNSVLKSLIEAPILVGAGSAPIRQDILPVYADGGGPSALDIIRVSPSVDAEAPTESDSVSRG